MKAAWLVLVIVLPYVGVFAYLVTQSKGIAERRMGEVQAAQAQMDAYVQSVAGTGGAAAEIEKAHQLLSSGAITQAEFDAIKAKALAA